MLGRKPPPQFWAWPLGIPRPRVSYITTNAGRFCVSVPRPYVTHEPTQGKPIRVEPVLILNSAGEWLFESVWHERRKAILSTCLAISGKISETQAPHWPCCSNLNGDFITGPTCSVKKPVSLSKPSSSFPSRFSSSGL